MAVSYTHLDVYKRQTKDGEYYGYAVLARKIGQIIHDTVEVDTRGATEPIFGKTLC